MATAVRVIKYKLRQDSPMPIINVSSKGCVSDPPTSYVVQTFGVEVSNVDSWDAIIGLYGSEAMQGLQNYPELDGSTGRPDLVEEQAFSEHAFTRISYTGTDLRDTDDNLIFKGSEEHTSYWVDEEDSGLIWL